MNILVHLLADKIAGHVTSHVKSGLSPVAPYLRKLSMGILLIVVSLFGWIFGLLFLVMGIFFYFGQLSNFVEPAFWANGISSLMVHIILPFEIAK